MPHSDKEAAQQLIDLATGSDVFAQMTPDLIAKDLQLLQGDELHKRMRKFMIGQGIATPTEEEIEELGLNQEQAPDPQQQAITENIQIQTEKLISEIEEKKTLKQCKSSWTRNRQPLRHTKSLFLPWWLNRKPVYL